ncbi:ARID-like protein [Venustampulla echinocandica]|uniref:ARID-like protein n=1 Tax=Venustampulla echinocandica TaxID=2656787 RepID=A0A370TND4_9HELO|nr:ARID-like protein [Venustampulla echinocandica]RDL37043.1 ARID-like protein [Venustampulla echinocandica]
MASSPNRGGSPSAINYSPEYVQFIEKLAVYHEKRGTEFVREPKVGSRQIDLLKLFNIVMERGGYDKVSDEKLAWRKLGQDFNLGSPNLPALAFALKSVYYKNLAAYEISTVHGKEPPPKEILEDLTAKGGGLLTRTLENYKPPSRREPGTLDHSEASGDDGTPARDRNGSEEAPGSGGRATRGLRQAPPQRILFQPDTQPSRQTRHAASHTSSPQQAGHHQQHQPRGASTSYNPSSNMENMSLAVANYEPRPQMPLTLRPVITPGNNPVEFARRQKAKRDNLAAASGRPAPATNRGVMLPGSGFDGPNIYVRCLCALRSGIPAEQDYALHHLVKISMERGDKYRFESFPGLAEALIEKLLEVSSLFYEVDWHVSYAEDGSMTSRNTLNGVDGTPDILQTIAQLPKLDVNDNVLPAGFNDALLQINEAALTMRNMVMLEDNAHYVSEMAPLRDMLCIALNLPNHDSLVELKHYALDITEQITKYLPSDETDPLYISLLVQLQSEDLGAILTSLRAISRISMNLEENNLLKGVPVAGIQNILDWTILNDEELVHACLDFLYQYTAVVENVDFLITELQVEPLINQLVRLLAHGVKIHEKEFSRGPEFKKEAPLQIAPLPKELLAQLLKLDEPERSSQWLRCLFEEDSDESITQIALWQAYQAQFMPTTIETGRQLLPAAEFIKNVSTTFGEKATAQVQSGPVQKFIIKGIRMRSVPVDFFEEEYSKCLWKVQPGHGSYCGEFFMSPEEMYKHMLQDHIHAQLLPDGKFDNTQEGQYVCQWDSCSRFKTAPATKLAQLGQHIKVHLPPRPSAASRGSNEHGPPPSKKLKPSYILSSPKQKFKYETTAVDERQFAAGVPLSAVLVLRNLARNLPKTEAEETAQKTDGISWVDRLFRPVVPRLYEVMSHNRALVEYMTDLLGSINDAYAG